LVGNKKDLRTGKSDSIQENEGKQMAQRIGAQAYVECSALNGDGVREVFERATQLALKKQKKKSNSSCDLI
jgi:Ras family protein A